MGLDFRGYKVSLYFSFSECINCPEMELFHRSECLLRLAIVFLVVEGCASQYLRGKMTYNDFPPQNDSVLKYFIVNFLIILRYLCPFLFISLFKSVYLMFELSHGHKKFDIYFDQ